ncbi:MAG: hypothetical protein J6W35_07770 [Eubacterium sp.]|nr:hypothetical protein [Eubacterium sp.]
MTQKKTGIDGYDYAWPVRPTILPCPSAPPMPPIKPPYPVPVYPFYPPVGPGPVPTPFIPGYIPQPPVPPCPPPPYFPPKPSKTDARLKKLQADIKRLELVQTLITKFEQKNEVAILTIGGESYQFGTDRITNSEKEVVDGTYANVICANEAVPPTSEYFDVDLEELSVTPKAPTDLLQTEKSRLSLEIQIITQALYEDEQSPSSDEPTAL